ncbi:hypothetical protein KRX56_06585 [Dermabacteraceae bacterium TAE3-ERU27]|nr:hypothetical protein [Dermabacteraceae bacterium TAE3-ERU27]
MDWDRLLVSLSAQMVQQESLEARNCGRELIAAQRAEVSVLQRLRATIGKELSLQVAAGQIITGVLGEVGPDWLLLGQRDGAGRCYLVPNLGGVVFYDLPSRPVEQAPIFALSLGGVLRALAAERRPLRVHWRDGQVAGVVLNVGKDFVELRAEGGGRVTLPYACLTLVLID